MIKVIAAKKSLVLLIVKNVIALKIINASNVEVNTS